MHGACHNIFVGVTKNIGSGKKCVTIQWMGTQKPSVVHPRRLWQHKGLRCIDNFARPRDLGMHIHHKSPHLHEACVMASSGGNRNRSGVG